MATTLIVETGAIITNADSYVTLEEAAAYHSKRGNTAWASAGSDTVREQALRKATAYLDGFYYPRWKGTQVNPLSQSLQWPRAGVKLSQDQQFYDIASSFYDVNYGGFLPVTTIPAAVKSAQCELALRALSTQLAEDLDRGGRISSVTVGPITQSYEPGAPASKKYHQVDLILAPLLASANVALVRS